MKNMKTLINNTFMIYRLT